jgi:hypothetical protein
MKNLLIGTILSLVASSQIAIWKDREYAKATFVYQDEIPDKWFTNDSGVVVTERKSIRKPDQTFLTYPEWYLVFAPEEQASFFKTKTSTDFPYLTQLDQFWKSYDILKLKTLKHYPYNEEYHTMIKIIGYSTEVEYKTKAWYETVIGRLTKNKQLSSEDKFYQKFTADYASSLHKKFWYDYDFTSTLKKLWFEEDFFGPQFLRKMERKYIISSELLVKIAYGKLIKFGAHTLYGQSPENTMVVLDQKIPSFQNDLFYVKQDSINPYVYSLPRYTDFMKGAFYVSSKKANFKEIAGNKGLLLITLIGKKDFKIPVKNGKLLFRQSISTDTNIFRYAMVIKVNELSKLLSNAKQEAFNIEHVYDY